MRTMRLDVVSQRFVTQAGLWYLMTAGQKYRGMKIMNNPKYYDWHCYGLYFKLGMHGFIYRWVHGEWRKTEETAQELSEQVHREKQQARLDYIKKRG